MPPEPLQGQGPTSLIPGPYTPSKSFPEIQQVSELEVFEAKFHPSPTDHMRH